MVAKQHCQHCGTHIEFDADQIGSDGYTILCPQCQAPVTLLRPPPIAVPPLITKKQRSYLWILGVGAIAFVMLCILGLVADRIQNRSIVPEFTAGWDVPSNDLERQALDLGIKELNKIFYKSNESVFAHEFRKDNVDEYNPQHRYVQGKRVAFGFVHNKVSEADVLNGLEYNGELAFFFIGARRFYVPGKDKGWSEWTMEHSGQIILRVTKKNGGDWEFKQPPENTLSMVPLPREKVEELLRLPEQPSSSR